MPSSTLPPRTTFAVRDATSLPPFIWAVDSDGDPFTESTARKFVAERRAGLIPDLRILVEVVEVRPVTGWSA